MKRSSLQAQRSIEAVKRGDAAAAAYYAYMAVHMLTIPRKEDLNISSGFNTMFCDVNRFKLRGEP